MEDSSKKKLPRKWVGEAVRIGDEMYSPKLPFLGIWDNYIVPISYPLNRYRVFPALVDLMDLLASEGYCPSFIVGEKTVSRKTASQLSKIHLVTHSVNVTVQMLQIFEKQMGHLVPEFKIGTPQILVAGLAHDIGKLPRHAGDDPDSHPCRSADFVKELFIKHNVKVPWLEWCLEAIRNHHGAEPGSDIAGELTAQLQQADLKTRERELRTWRTLSEGNFPDNPVPILRCEGWLDHTQLLWEIYHATNQWDYVKKARVLQAFSWRDTIFVRPQFLYAIARTIYRKKWAVDFQFEYNTPYAVAQATRSIIGTLHKLRLLREDFDPAVSPNGHWYELKSRYEPDRKHRMLVVPIPITHFKTTGKNLRGRADPWPKSITEMIKCNDRSLGDEDNERKFGEWSDD
jgi:hypothetical protein